MTLKCITGGSKPQFCHLNIYVMVKMARKESQGRTNSRELEPSFVEQIQEQSKKTEAV